MSLNSVASRAEFLHGAIDWDMVEGQGTTVKVQGSGLGCGFLLKAVSFDHFPKTVCFFYDSETFQNSSYSSNIGRINLVIIFPFPKQNLRS